MALGAGGVADVMSLYAIPLTPSKASNVVARLHRHHGPIPSGYGPICIAAVDERRICGAVIIGRPINRNSDDGQTLEVLRLATDGTFNASSFLLGAAAKTARSMGAARLITYTLETETGASLRGAGWVQEAENIESWWTAPAANGRSVKPRDHYDIRKVRWTVTFREPIAIDDESILLPAELPGMTLF